MHSDRMTIANVVVRLTVCTLLVFSHFSTDAISFASFGLTFFELDLGTANLISRPGLEGAVIASRKQESL